MQQASEQDGQVGTQRGSNGQWSRSVGLRVITAVVLIPIVLGFLWLGGWWSFALAALVVARGMYELRKMTLHAGYQPLILISLALSLVFLIAAMLPPQRLILLEIGISAALLLTFTLLFFRKQIERAVVDWALTIAFAVYLGWPMSFLLLLRGYQIGWSSGLWWLLTLFGCVWGFDTGAFFTGHFLGRHKLAPMISPGKTWEGTVGGMVVSIVAALVLATVPLGVPWYLTVPLGILIGVAATLGDLAESLLKRQTHVKDSGGVLPGHGGILDRIDSLLFGAVVIYFFVLLIGKF